MDTQYSALPGHAAGCTLSGMGRSAAGRFAESIAEEIARLRSLRTGEDVDLSDE